MYHLGGPTNPGMNKSTPIVHDDMTIMVLTHLQRLHPGSGSHCIGNPIKYYVRTLVNQYFCNAF